MNIQFTEEVYEEPGNYLVVPVDQKPPQIAHIISSNLPWIAYHMGKNLHF